MLNNNNFKMKTSLSDFIRLPMREATIYAPPPLMSARGEGRGREGAVVINYQPFYESIGGLGVKLYTGGE